MFVRLCVIDQLRRNRRGMGLDEDRVPLEASRTNNAAEQDLLLSRPAWDEKAFTPAAA
jgi:hypothetical protein